MKKFFSLISILALTSTGEVFANNFTLQSSEFANPVVTSPSKEFYSNGFAQGFADFYSRKNVLEVAGNVAANAPVYSSRGGISTQSSSRPDVIASRGISHDPYVLQIDGNKYMLIKENNDKKFNKQDILGITDTQETVFASLKPLDINNDSKLTGEELTKSNVRLVKIGKDGKLINDKKQDFQNSKIVYIYMKELRKAYKNNGDTGDFGMYDVLVKNDNGTTKLVTGYVTFESEEELSRYF